MGEYNYYDDFIKDIKEYLGDIIINQDEVVDKLLVGVNYAVQKSYMNMPNSKTTMFLNGESGTGKSTLVREIMDLMPVPVYLFDIANYNDNMINDCINSLLEQSNFDMDLFEHSIIIVDNVDKILDYGKGKDCIIDNYANLLNTLKGYVYNGQITIGEQVLDAIFDTKKMPILFVGDFSKFVGFGINAKSEFLEYLENTFEGDKLYIKTRNYDKKDYYDIMTKSVYTPLNITVSILKKFGFKNISVSETFIDAVLDYASAKNKNFNGVNEVFNALNIYLYNNLMKCEELGENIVLTGELVSSALEEEKKLKLT